MGIPWSQGDHDQYHIVVLSALLLPPEILNQGCIGTQVPNKQLIPSSDNWITLETLEVSIKKYTEETQWGFMNCESIDDIDVYPTKN